MAQSETEYTSARQERKLWPLATVMWLDLLVIIAAVVVLAGSVQAAFLALRAAQEGLDLATLADNPTELLRLVGADGLFVSTLVQNLICVLIPVLRVRVIRGEPLAEIGLRAREPLRLLLTGIGLGVAVLVSNVLLGLLLNELGIRQNQSEQYPLYRGDYTGQTLFWITAAVLAPVGEEVLFRGYIFNALRQSYAARPWGLALAFGLSALLFSLAHSLAATRDVIGLLIPTFVMGLLLAWGSYRTGSVIPSIIAHTMNNGLAVMGLIACINGTISCP
ncbi:MAG TPA: CPBP family intramembrane glutamic endopeptidase [Roseiflexaceae bacterium]|nr:CPBP family intramembrane glutamic endopeptidase [Roseiflexaceae bacterium]